MRSSDRKPPRAPAGTDVTVLSLADAMRALGLDHAASLLDGASQKAISRGETPTALLDHLIREQLRVTLEQRAHAAVRRAAIFPLTTMETYDFAYPKSIDRELVTRAATLAFIEDKANVVFLGPSGVGKTHLANALGHLACLRGLRVRFVLAADLVNDLVAAAARNTLHRRLAAWTAPDLVLIDELGYLSFDARGADLLYQVFNRRYQRASTIVTTNLPFKDWGTLFHNSAAASAIADRLVHKGLLVQITGKSRRSDREVNS
ncbi:MAG: IS21-like element helper ATPase IstB [Polyangiaceae bacterium]